MLTRPETTGRLRRRAARLWLVALLLAVPACGDDDDDTAADDAAEAAESTAEAEPAEAADEADAAAATDAAAGSLTPDGLLSQARTCEDLAADPVFGGKATVIGEMSGGDALGCDLEVRADSPLLQDLNLTTTDCDPDDGITLPFTRTDDGWRFARDSLAGVNTGTCSVEAG